MMFSNVTDLVATKFNASTDGKTQLRHYISAYTTGSALLGTVYLKAMFLRGCRLTDPLHG